MLVQKHTPGISKEGGLKLTMKLTRSHQTAVAVVILLAAFMLAGHAQAQPSNETIWQQFLQWLSSTPPLDNPGPLFNQYRSRLIAAGASTAEADRQMDIIRRTMRERPDGWRIMFNNIYSSSTPGFVTQPNALLISTVEGRKPGRALDIGMGQGRNSVFLACCTKVIMSGVNGNVIMSGCRDDTPDDERREAARDNTKSISRG